MNLRGYTQCIGWYEHLRQGSQIQGPGAKSGPRLHLMWPARACKEYNTFIIWLHATLHVPQCISRTEETCNYLPWTSAFRRS